MSLVTRHTIEAFYAEHRIAVIGASRDPKKYGRRLVQALQDRGYDVIPVNPKADRIGSLACYKTISEVAFPIPAAILVVPPSGQADVALECAKAGIKKLWIHEHVMKGLSNPKAIYHCEEAGIEVITGFCPFMFMPKPGFPHNLHGRITQWMGAFPR